MRRIVPLVLISAALAGCDPTGNGAPTTSGSSDFRVANFVTDANGLNVSDNDGPMFSNITFTSVSLYKLLPEGSEVVTLKQASDNFQIGVDSLTLVKSRRYTLYAMGEMTALKSLLIKNDTVPATAGQYKIRFIHGIESYSPFALDFFDDTTTSLTGLTPSWPGLGYGVGSLYIPVDTGVRRIRITKTGLTTTILDTLLPNPIASGSVITLVASNVVGGGAGIQVHIVADTIP